MRKFLMAFFDIVADLDIVIHDDSVWRQRFRQNDRCPRDFAPSNIEAATPSRWLGSAAVAIETNCWRSVFVILTSGSEFKLDTSRGRSFEREKGNRGTNTIANPSSRMIASSMLLAPRFTLNHDGWRTAPDALVRVGSALPASPAS